MNTINIIQTITLIFMIGGYTGFIFGVLSIVMGLKGMIDAETESRIRVSLHKNGLGIWPWKTLCLGIICTVILFNIEG